MSDSSTAVMGRTEYGDISGLAIQCPPGPLDTPLPPVRRLKAANSSETLLATVNINGTAIDIIETPGGAACNNCPFAMPDPMPHGPPLCCIPDYLACRNHLKFSIVENTKGPQR